MVILLTSPQDCLVSVLFLRVLLLIKLTSRTICASLSINTPTRHKKTRTFQYSIIVMPSNMRANIVCPISFLFFPSFPFLPKRLCVSIDTDIRRCSDVETPNRRYRQLLGRIHTERLRLWLRCADLSVCNISIGEAEVYCELSLGSHAHWIKADVNVKQNEFKITSIIP